MEGSVDSVDGEVREDSVGPVDSVGRVLSSSVDRLEDMGLFNLGDGGVVSLSVKGDQLMQGDGVLRKAWDSEDFDLFLSRTLELMG